MVILGAREGSPTCQGWKGGELQRLFAHLESEEVRQRLSITSFGVRDSSLEDIFLKVAGKAPAASGCPSLVSPQISINSLE